MHVLDFIHHLTWHDLPAPVQNQATRCLLDVIGTAIAGRATPLSQIIHDYAVQSHGGRGGFLWQDGRDVSPPGAALANGMTVDALDIHDGHSLTKGHAGAAVVPAAFAALGLGDGIVSGEEFLTMIVVGYEVALRAGIAQHATAPDYHSSGSWNALGCAALAARRMKLSPAQTAHALGIAEYHGPRSQMMRCVDHPTMLKDGSGWGAMTGVSAAMLSANGFTGAPSLVVESESTKRYWSDLGARYEMLGQYFKPHAVCRWAQPAVEGAVLLKQRHAIAPESITRIEIETFHEATRLAARKPASTEEAQYSLPFPVAAALVHGELGPQQLIGDALTDERVLRLSRLIEIRESAELNAHFPARRYAHVTITAAGERYEARYVEPRWDATSPPSDEELVEKFRRLTTEVGGVSSKAIETAIRQCATCDDVTALASLIMSR